MPNPEFYYFHFQSLLWACLLNFCAAIFLGRVRSVLSTILLISCSNYSHLVRVMLLMLLFIWMLIYRPFIKPHVFTRFLITTVFKLLIHKVHTFIDKNQLSAGVWKDVFLIYEKLCCLRGKEHLKGRFQHVKGDLFWCWALFRRKEEKWDCLGWKG